MKLGDLYAALTDLTGEPYSKSGQHAKWIDDLCVDFDRAAVGRAMYAVKDPMNAKQLLSRVSRHLRDGAEL